MNGKIIIIKIMTSATKRGERLSAICIIISTGNRVKNKTLIYCNRKGILVMLNTVHYE